MVTWHTDKGSVTADDAGAILATFGPSAFYRPDEFLKPEAIGRIVTQRGERTVALVFSTPPEEETIARAWRKASNDLD